MNINRTAHDILGHLSKNKWHVHKLGDGSPTYRLLMYEWVTFDLICKIFEGRDPKEIRFSIEELIKNGHVEKRWGDNWKEVRAIQSGEIAFEKGVYIKIDDKEKADKSDNFLKRHWWLTHILTLAIGVAIPLTIDQLNNQNRKSEPTTVNEADSIKPIENIELKQDSLGKNDTTATTKK